MFHSQGPSRYSPNLPRRLGAGENKHIWPPQILAGLKPYVLGTCTADMSRQRQEGRSFVQSGYCSLPAAKTRAQLGWVFLLIDLKQWLCWWLHFLVSAGVKLHGIWELAIVDAPAVLSST